MTTQLELDAIDPIFLEALCLMQLFLFLGFDISQVAFACRATTAKPADSLFPDRPFSKSDPCVLITLTQNKPAALGLGSLGMHTWTGCVGPAPYSDLDREVYWKRAFDAFWSAPPELVRPIWEKSRAQSKSADITGLLRRKGFRIPSLEEAPAVIIH
jgi:hypothetical protein